MAQLPRLLQLFWLFFVVCALLLHKADLSKQDLLEEVQAKYLSSYRDKSLFLCVRSRVLSLNHSLVLNSFSSS